MHNPVIHLFNPPKILHNHCLQVLLGYEDVLREIKNKAYANFWGVKEVYYGICASSTNPDTYRFVWGKTREKRKSKLDPSSLNRKHCSMGASFALFTNHSYLKMQIFIVFNTLTKAVLCPAKRCKLEYRNELCGSNFNH